MGPGLWVVGLGLWVMGGRVGNASIQIKVVLSPGMNVIVFVYIT